MTGIIEVDVTKAKLEIKRKKEQGIDISFTGWLLYCLSKAIQMHPHIYAMRKGRGKIIQYGEIDIIVMIEKRVESGYIAVPYAVRNSNEKSLEQISAEIREQQIREVDESRQLLSNHWSMKIYRYLPRWIRMWIIKRIVTSADRIKQQGGLAVITSVGMFSNNYGWILGFGGLTTLGLSIGTITSVPKYVGDTIVRREVMNMTVNIDHDIVDGAPAARFARDLVNSMENAEGLNDNKSKNV